MAGCFVKEVVGERGLFFFLSNRYYWRMVSYEDFSQLQLRIARIIEAARVEGLEKLLKLSVDAGEEAPRQIIAGLGLVYEPEDLVGKQVVVIINLEPRTIMGFSSNGMVLAAHDADGNPVILIPEKETPAGASIS